MALSEYESKVLNHLYSVRRWESTKLISKLTELSWETVNDALTSLHGDGFVLYKDIGKKNLWKFNFEKWTKLRNKLIKK